MTKEQQSQPIAWMVYTLDGTSVCVTDNPTDFTPEHRALPLYTAPVKADIKPLSEAEIYNLACVATDANGFSEIAFARAIESAHGIKE